MRRLVLALLVGLLASAAPREAAAWIWSHYQVCPNMMRPCYGCCRCPGSANYRGYPQGHCHGSWGYWPGYKIGRTEPVCRCNGFANFRYAGVGTYAYGYGYGFGSTPPGAGFVELYW